MPLPVMLDQHTSDTKGGQPLRERPPPLEALSLETTRFSDGDFATPHLDGKMTARSARTAVSLSTTKSSRMVRKNLLGPLALPSMPKCFCCAMCGEILTEPTSAADGLNYDRKCIETWLKKGHRNSPVTKAPLQSLDLYPNDALKDCLGQYLSLREVMTQDHKRWRGFVVVTEDRVLRKLAQKDSQVRDLKATLRSKLVQHSRSNNGAPLSPDGSATTTSPRSTRSSSTATISSSSGGTVEDNNPSPQEFVATLTAVAELSTPVVWGAGSAPRTSSSPPQQGAAASARKSRLRSFCRGWWRRDAAATSSRRSKSHTAPASSRAEKGAAATE
mmetsp:Transcript_3789/g.9165  ORF Transcript_3789/g.9165 Transcript_3789/m.9165 type:complete len:331 (+) Transcript_3789:56-1048(+)